MTNRKHRIFAATLLSVMLVACQPAVLQPAQVSSANSATTSLGAPNGATISVSVGLLRSMVTQALPKSALDVNNYKVSLFDNVSNAQVGSTITIAGPGVTGSFTAVPAGTYYIKANAFSDAASLISIVVGGVAIQSLNTVTISNGTAAYTNTPSGVATQLVVNLQLIDGTPGTGASNITIASRTTALATADKCGVSLMNNASRRALANPVNPSITYQLSTVQDGAKTGGTHEIWTFAVDSVNSLVSMPKPTGSPAEPVNGAIAATIPITMVARTIETPIATPTAVTGPLRVNVVGDVFFVDGIGDIKRSASGAAFALSTAVANPGVLTGWCVAIAGAAVLFSTGTDVKVSSFSGTWSAPTTIRTAANVGVVAIDERSDLYWYDTVAGKILRSTPDATGYATPYIVATPGAPVTAMSPDGYGNIYYTTGANVFKVPLDTDETTYLAQAQVVTAAGITSMDVDRVGNIYFTDGSAFIKFVGAGETTIYKLAGSGSTTGADNLTFQAPLSTPLQAAARVSVNVLGQMYFTSLGLAANGSQTYIRRLL